MAVTGTPGLLLGVTDAAAFCDRITRCINGDELTLPPNDLLVFLDVPAGTYLSADYWAGWAKTVYAAPVAVVEDVSGATVAPTIKMPFAPAILCKFTLGGDQRYTVDANVSTCLNAVEAAYPREQVACYGFWAVAADTPALNSIPKPKLDWMVFTPYSQPIEMNATQLVPVVMWRYGVPLGLAWAGGMPVNVDAANDDFTPLDSMLGIKSSWFMNADTGFNWGFDTDGNTAADADCISQARMTYSLGGVQIADHQPVNFVARYYDLNPPTNTHHLSQAEQTALQKAGLDVVVVWQTKRPPLTGIGPTSAAYLTSFGPQDALAAFAMASDYGQPAHTPVYFAIDFDVQPAAYAALQTYFGDLSSGYQQYLAQNRLVGLEPTPYAIGIYGLKSALEVCYRLGITSYFWQAVRHTRPLWAHTNVWQRTNAPFDDPTQVCNHAADFDESWGDPGSWYRLDVTVSFG